MVPSFIKWRKIAVIVGVLRHAAWAGKWFFIGNLEFASNCKIVSHCFYSLFLVFKAYLRPLVYSIPQAMIAINNFISLFLLDKLASRKKDEQLFGF